MNEWMELLFATLRLSTPLLFAALGGLLSERSGITNIALEGFMLAGAFTGAAIGHLTLSPWLGWMAAFAAGSLMASLYAASTIQGKSDQIVAGTAFNLFAIGFIPFLSKIIFNSTGSTPSIPLEQRLGSEPFVFALLSLIAIWFFLTRTRGGLWLQFAGEHPQALSASGVSVRRVRWLAVTIGGGLAAWGGATLSMALASSYSPLMSSGRGFIALAALISGKWKPWPTAIACLFFGFAEAVQIRLQGLEIGGMKIPVQFIQILPYVATLLVLAGLIGNSRAPKALGKELDEGEVS